MNVGQMTTAMRALPRPSGPKVLRVGRVIAGRVIEERVFERATVTIGSSPDCTFVVPSLARSFALFESDRTLNVEAGMKGRIALKGELLELSGPTRVSLDDQSRGKIIVGDTTFLFQFVERAPIQPKAALPSTVLAGSRVDWGFAVIAAFSFLLHFGFAGAVNSDWFDPMVDDGASTASLIEEARDRPFSPVEERVDDKHDQPTESKAKTTVVEKSAAPGPKTSEAKASSPDPVALSQQLEQIEMKALGSIGASGPAQSSLLKPGATTADSNLDEIAKKSAGIDTDGSLRLPSGSQGPLASNGKDGLSSGFNQTKTPPGPSPVDKSIQVKAPGEVKVVPVHLPEVKDVDAVIARNRWRFKSCYDKALAIDPNTSGTVRVTVRVGDGGDVISASANGDTPSALTECVRAAFTAMKFSAPESGSAQFTAPVVLSSGAKK